MEVLYKLTNNNKYHILRNIATHTHTHTHIYIYVCVIESTINFLIKKSSMFNELLLYVIYIYICMYIFNLLGVGTK